MADLDNDRTVVVERETRDVRDTREASSPLGWIILLILLLLALMFFLTDGFGLFGNNTTDTTEVQAPGTSETLEGGNMQLDNSQTNPSFSPNVTPDETPENN